MCENEKFFSIFFLQEYDLLYYNLTSARIFFRPCDTSKEEEEEEEQEEEEDYRKSTTTWKNRWKEKFMIPKSALWYEMISWFLI